MFVALARAVSRHRLAVLAGAFAILALAVLSIVRGGSLTSGTIEGTESARAAELVRGAAGADTDTSVVALFSHPKLAATDPVFQSALALHLDKVSARPEVESAVSVVSAPEQARARFISRDGRTALVLVRLKGDEKAAVKAFPAVKAALRDGPFTVAITGKPAFLFDLNTELEHDLLRAELISFPLALVVLLWVFRTLVAALLPIVVGGLAVLAGVGAVLALSHHLDMAQYTLNVVSLIGLGVAIDYSLFIVSRFRAELDGGSSVQVALERTVDTAGRAVAFSGLAVAAGLSGLLFYRGSFLAAMGLGGAIVVGFAVLFALTLLPVILGWLGRRVDLGRVPIPPFGLRAGLWKRLAGWVMKHPLKVLLPTLALVAFLGWPFVRLQTAGTDITALPESTEARQGAAALARAFPEQSATRILVAVEFPGNPFTPERVAALYDATRRWARLPGVVGVESIVNLDPRVTREQYLQLAGAAARVPSTGVRARRGGVPARERGRRAGAHPGARLQCRGAAAGEGAPAGPRGGGRTGTGRRTDRQRRRLDRVRARPGLARGGAGGSGHAGGAVRPSGLGGAPARGGGDELPLPRGELRGPGVDLPGGASALAPPLPARTARAGAARPPLLHPLRALDGLPGPHALADARGAGSDARQPRSRSPRASRGPGASSPARRRSWSRCSRPSPWRGSWWSRRWAWGWRLRLRSMPPW